MPTIEWTTPFTTGWTAPFTSRFDGEQTGAQSGSITIPNGSTSATFDLTPAVEPTRTLLFFNGFNTSNTTADMSSDFPRVSLNASGTQVVATRGGSTGDCVAGFSIIELPTSIVTNVQHHTITLGSTVTSNTQAIDAVNTSFAHPIWTGVSIDQTGDFRSTIINVMLEQTDATTITAARQTGVGTAIVSFNVVEWNPAVINSLQIGTATGLGATVASLFTSVTESQTALMPMGFRTNTDSGAGVLDEFRFQYPRTFLFDDIRFITAHWQGATPISRSYRAAVVEFVPGIISVQRDDLVQVNASAAVDSTITAVDRTRSVITIAGNDAPAGGNPPDSSLEIAALRTSLTSPTNIRTERNTADSNNAEGSWEVVEFNL